MSLIRNKVVLITGAAQGIGRQTAWVFAREGARLVLSDINEEQLEYTAGQIAEAGHEVINIQVDLRDRDQVYDMVDRTLVEMGRVDIIVNNAGVVFTRKFTELDEQQIIDNFRVNLFAPIWMLKRALPSMIRRRSGHIVNVGSIAGKISNPNITVYCASKFAIVGLSDSLRQELKPYGIQVTCVNPGLVTSGMFKGAKAIPIARWKPPRFIAEARVRAVQENKQEIIRPRQLWILAFLRTLLGPKHMDRVYRFFHADQLFGRVEVNE